MSRDKATRILIREDEPTNITSSRRGANLDAVVFNLRFMLQRQPSLAIKVTELYFQARQLRANDSEAPEEDVKAAEEEWTRLIKDVYGD